MRLNDQFLDVTREGLLVEILLLTALVGDYDRLLIRCPEIPYTVEITQLFFPNLCISLLTNDSEIRMHCLFLLIWLKKYQEGRPSL